MLSVRSEQLHETGFPTVHAVVLLEGTMNLTGEIQPLVEQLMMVKRMQVGPGPRGNPALGCASASSSSSSLLTLLCPQHIPTPLFVLEIWKACFVGLIESPEGTEELKWTAFTYLKVPLPPVLS